MPIMSLDTETSHDCLELFAEPLSYADRMVTVEDVRRLAQTLPRAYEVLVRSRIKFRVGSFVLVSFSRDEKLMGFAYPKEQREDLVTARPDTFQLPVPSEMRDNWVAVRLEAIDIDEMRQLVLGAWKMVVPRHLARQFFGDG